MKLISPCVVSGPRGNGTSRKAAGGVLMVYRIRKRDLYEGHGVEGHPPDEFLRWDKTPLQQSGWLVYESLFRYTTYVSQELNKKRINFIFRTVFIHSYYTFY